MCDRCRYVYITTYNCSHMNCSSHDNDNKYELLTRSRVKDEYLLNDDDIDARLPLLRFIAKKNPHNPRWGDMKLYLKIHVS